MRDTITLDDIKNQMIWQKKVTIMELDEIYALVEVCHDTLKEHSVLGLESVEKVLNITYNQICTMTEKEKMQLEDIKEKEQQIES